MSGVGQRTGKSKIGDREKLEAFKRLKTWQ